MSRGSPELIAAHKEEIIAACAELNESAWAPAFRCAEPLQPD